MMKKYLIGVIVIAIFGLGSTLWYQANMISELRATVTMQAETIKQEDQINHQLTESLEIECKAVEYQQKLTNELRAKVEMKREKIRTIFKTEPCANTVLPHGIIEQLH